MKTIPENHPFALASGVLAETIPPPTPYPYYLFTLLTARSQLKFCADIMFRMGPTRFYDWREWRRFRAVELARLGWVHRDIAAALGVSEAAVSQWLACARKAGTDGLVAHPHGGHVKLTPEQQRLVPDFLWHGAEAYGFRGDVWTCARIAKVLRWEFGLSFHKDHVSRMLKAMGWTPQIPITRAIQRNEEEIERWRTETWPKLRSRACKERRTLIFTDESGFYLLPAVVRTYGPKGETPVLPHRAGRNHLSIRAYSQKGAIGNARG